MGCFTWLLLVALAWKLLGVNVVIWLFVISIILSCIFID